MHSAPSVSYPVGRSRDAARLLWIIWAAGACCACAASYQFDSNGWRRALLMVAVALATAAVHRTLRAVWPAGKLGFDGRHWSLSAPDARPIVEVMVTLDLQFLLLVHLRGEGASLQWRWLERRADPARWNDVRRALYSRLPKAAEGVAPAAP